MYMTLPRFPSETEADATVVNRTLHASKADLRERGNLKRISHIICGLGIHSQLKMFKISALRISMH